MKITLYGVAAIVALVIVGVGGRSSSAQAKQDKYTLKIPGGLAFSEIRGYEQWQVVGPSLTQAANVIRVIVADRDCEAGVEAEKYNRSSLFGEHAGHSTRRAGGGRVHREGRQEVSRHARLGVRDV